jgi:hypothetical protein
VNGWSFWLLSPRAGGPCAIYSESTSTSATFTYRKMTMHRMTKTTKTEFCRGIDLERASATASLSRSKVGIADELLTKTFPPTTATRDEQLCLS